MAFVPRYAGRDWLQVVQVAVSASVEPQSSGCTLLAAGFSRAGTPSSHRFVTRVNSSSVESLPARTPDIRFGTTRPSDESSERA